MTSPTIETWDYVEITLKSLLDGTSTKTIRISSRTLIDEADGITVYWPILKAISGLGSEMEDYLPASGRGSIEINNAPGTFGRDRKFSDLFERYSLYGATVKIYSAQTTIDDTSITSDFTLDWQTTAIRYSFEGSTLRVEVAEVGISSRPVSKVIDPVSFPYAPSSSIGKELPLIFGDSIPIKPISAGATSTGQPAQFLYGTTFGSDFKNGGIATYQARDISGEYKTILSAGTTSTPLFQVSLAVTGQISTFGNTAFAQVLHGSGSNNGYILTRGKISLFGNNAAGTVSGTIRVRILGANTIGGVPYPDEDRVIASAKIEKATYSAQFLANAAFWAEFAFDKPAVIAPSTYYYVEISGANEVSPSVTKINVGVSTATWAVKSESNSTYVVTVGAAYEFNHEFYGVVLTDSFSGNIDSSGLSYSYFTADATGSPGTVDASKLDFTVLVNGITDNGSGDITGIAGARLRAPHHVVTALDLQWDGSSWSTTGAKIDTSKFVTAISQTCESSTTSSSFAYPRQIGGYSEGRETVEDLLREICRCSAMKITRYNDATRQFTLWPWGLTAATVATITDEDCKLLSVRQLGPEAVVNRIVMQYFKDPRGADLITSAQLGTLKGYDYTKIYDVDSSTLTDLLSRISVNLYGRRELSRSAFDWISANLTAFAESIAQYFLRVFAHPHVFAEVEVPKVKYRAVDMLDIVEIIHPSLSQYLGSSPIAPLPYYDGVAVEALGGEYLKRAGTYRAQVEGKQQNYNVSGYPTFKLNCRLLINPNDPT